MKVIVFLSRYIFNNNYIILIYYYCRVSVNNPRDEIEVECAYLKFHIIMNVKHL